MKPIILFNCILFLTSSSKVSLVQSGDCQSLCGTVSEDGNLTFSAPVGYKLGSVLFASFGTPTGSCGSFSASSCNSVNSTSVIQAACSGQEFCSIPAVNSEFGTDPCYSTKKSLSVEICYESAAPTAAPSVSTTIAPSTTTEAPVWTRCTIVCGEVAENDYLTLSAPLGYALGEVLFASYGNPAGSCGAYSVGSCDAVISKSVVGAFCSGQTSCSIPAGHSEFGGDPCYSTDKRLAVEMCLSSVNLTTGPSSIPTQLPTTLLTAPTIPPASDGGYLCGEVMENDYLILSAPVGSILGDVVFASFGTPSGSCGSYNISSCNSPSSVAVVSSYCTGQATCSIPAGNTEFGGDPCYSQLKQLFVEIRYIILPSSEPTVGQVTSLPTSSVYFGPSTVPSHPGKGSYYPSSVPTGFPSDYEGGHPSGAPTRLPMIFHQSFQSISPSSMPIRKRAMHSNWSKTIPSAVHESTSDAIVVPTWAPTYNINLSATVFPSGSPTDVESFPSGSPTQMPSIHQVPEAKVLDQDSKTVPPDGSPI